MTSVEKDYDSFLKAFKKVLQQPFTRKLVDWGLVSKEGAHALSANFNALSARGSYGEHQYLCGIWPSGKDYYLEVVQLPKTENLYRCYFDFYSKAFRNQNGFLSRVDEIRLVQNAQYLVLAKKCFVPGLESPLEYSWTSLGKDVTTMAQEYVQLSVLLRSLRVDGK